jgi:hypothetical protein
VTVSSKRVRPTNLLLLTSFADPGTLQKTSMSHGTTLSSTQTQKR